MQNQTLCSSHMFQKKKTHTIVDILRIPKYIYAILNPNENENSRAYEYCFAQSYTQSLISTWAEGGCLRILVNIIDKQLTNRLIYQLI